MTPKAFILKSLRKLYRKLHLPLDLNDRTIFDRATANAIITHMLQQKEPCMITRYGSIELQAMLNYMAINSKASFSSKCFDFITKEAGYPWPEPSLSTPLFQNAGVFPPTTDILLKFGERFYHDTLFVDLLGACNYQESLIPLRENIQRVHLEVLSPFFTDHPWTGILANKKVLIIHPYETSIRSQYTRREKLFQNPELLPDFDLKILKAIQSIGGNNDFTNWFEALSYMENEINKIDFDIAIIGCGAYGLPLAAYVKRLGKKAFHLGGATQLLFGIKGNRWDDPDYGKTWPHYADMNTSLNYSSLYNEYWVRPLPEETPVSANKVERACYW